MFKLTAHYKGSKSVDYDLLGDKITLGRKAKNNIALNDRFVSSFHAELNKLEDGNYEIVDLGSHNGTYINGERVEKGVVKSGDKLKIGVLDCDLTGEPVNSLVASGRQRRQEQAAADAVKAPPAAAPVQPATQPVVAKSPAPKPAAPVVAKPAAPVTAKPAAPAVDKPAAVPPASMPAAPAAKVIAAKPASPPPSAKAPAETPDQPAGKPAAPPVAKPAAPAPQAPASKSPSPPLAKAVPPAAATAPPKQTPPPKAAPVPAPPETKEPVTKPGTAIAAAAAATAAAPSPHAEKELKELRADLDRKSRDLEESGSQLRELKEKLAKQEDQQKTAYADKTSALESTVAAREEENEKLRARIAKFEDIEARLEQANSRLQESHAQLASTKNENDQRDKKILQLENQVENLRTREQKLLEFETQFNSEKAGKEKLERQLANLELIIENLKQNESKMVEFESRIAQHEAEKDLLVKRTHSLEGQKELLEQKKEGDTRAYEARLASLQEELDTVKRNEKEARLSLAAEEKQSARQKESLESALRETQGKFASLSGELAEARAEFERHAASPVPPPVPHGPPVEELQAQIGKLEEKNAELQKSNIDLVENFKAQLAGQQTELGNLGRAREESTREVEELRKAYNASLLELEELKHAHNESERELRQAKQENQGLHDAREQRPSIDSAELQDLKARNAELEQANIDLVQRFKSNLAEHQKEVAELKSLPQETAAQLDETRRRYEEIRSHNEMELAGALEKINSLKSLLNQTKAKLSDAVANVVEESAPPAVPRSSPASHQPEEVQLRALAPKEKEISLVKLSPQLSEASAKMKEPPFTKRETPLQPSQETEEPETPFARPAGQKTVLPERRLKPTMAPSERRPSRRPERPARESDSVPFQLKKTAEPAAAPVVAKPVAPPPKAPPAPAARTGNGDGPSKPADSRSKPKSFHDLELKAADLRSDPSRIRKNSLQLEVENIRLAGPEEEKTPEAREQEELTKRRNVREAEAALKQLERALGGSR